MAQEGENQTNLDFAVKNFLTWGVDGRISDLHQADWEGEKQEIGPAERTLGPRSHLETSAKVSLLP
jgi:hypothetical protein